MSWRNTVYKLIFPDNRVYIGSTSNIKSRWSNHGAQYQGVVKAAIQKFGWDNIRKEIVLKLPPSVENESICLRVERELIKAYNDRSYNTLGTELNNRTRTNHLKQGFPKLFWTIDGKTMSAVEWCRLYNKNLSTVIKRMEHQGLTAQQALSFPIVPKQFVKKPREFWQSKGLL